MPAKLRPSISAPILAAVLALATLVMPGTAFAATNISFGHENDPMFIGGTWVTGRATPNSQVHVAWKNKAGLLKASITAPVSSSGNWQYISTSQTVAIGDQFKANDGSSIRRFTVPTVTIVVDRAADLYRGKAPANSAMSLWFHAGLYADFYQQEDLTSNSIGKWKFSDPIVGGIDAWIEWRGSKGDVVGASGMAPDVLVRSGFSNFSGDANPGQSIRIALRDGITDERLAVGLTVADDHGGFAGMFRNEDGDPVAVGTGDRVVGLSVAADLNWIVPEMEATTDVAEDIVSGTCHDAGSLTDSAIVLVRRGGQTVGFVLADVDENGHFEADFDAEGFAFLYDPANIRHGDRVVVDCRLVPGDLVNRGFLVP